MTNREYRRKGPYVVLSFLLLLFCVLCGVIVNSVLRGRVEKTDPHSADYPLTPLRGLLYGLLRGRLYGLVRGLPCGLP